VELRVCVSGDLARTFVPPEETAIEVKHGYNLEEAIEKRIEEPSVVMAVQRGNPPLIEGIAGSTRTNSSCSIPMRKVPGNAR
jgi:hypothetical protein